MQPYTQERFDRFCANIAEIYGAKPEMVGTPGARPFAIQGPNPAEHYASGATPTPQQRLVTRMQDSADFLKRINVIGVDQMSGETIGLNASTPAASRVDPAASPPQRRVPIDITGLDNFGYACVPTEFNPLFSYAKLDQWAKFPDFEIRMRDVILKRQALDRIQIGFNGTSQAAAAGMATGDPTLAGMNIGWPQWMRNNAPGRVLVDGAVTGKITYGAGGDYATIDGLIMDAKYNLLPAWAREDPDLVVISGSDIIFDKYFPIVNRTEGSLDMLAQLEIITSSKTMGGLPAYRAPFVPTGTLMITRFDNLSLYFQTGSMRRMLRDEPQWNRVVDYNSSNESYVVEDPNFICMVENVQAFGSTTGTLAETQGAADNDQDSL